MPWLWLKLWMVNSPLIFTRKISHFLYTPAARSEVPRASICFYSICPLSPFSTGGTHNIWCSQIRHKPALDGIGHYAVNGFHVAAVAGPESYEAGLFQKKSSVFRRPWWMIRRSRRLFFVISSGAKHVT
jgi:hypothetical protein